MHVSNPDRGSKSSELRDRDLEWKSFRDKADTDYQAEIAEEMRLRESVLPEMDIPFPSPIIFPDIVIEENIAITMRDGITLRADIYRPNATDRFPVVINRGPYDKLSSLDSTPAVARNLAKRGYICICQDVRGRYQSEGTFEPMEAERNDSVDTVEWAAEQSWSSGKVGMFGVSYNGFVQLQAAVGQAPHLRCIYPAMIGYGVDFNIGGIPMLQAAGWYIWAGQGREQLNPLRIDTNHLPLHEIDEKSGYPNRDFDAIVTNDTNVQNSVEVSKDVAEAELATIMTPTYMVAGWYDEVVNSTLDTWNQIAKTLPSAKLMIGPWHHNLCDMLEARIGKLETVDVELKRYYEQMELLFAHHLKGEANEVSLADSPIKMFVMGRNIWREESEWPLARTEFKKLYLHSNGEASTMNEDGMLQWQPPSGYQPADEYNYDPLQPVSWSSEAEVWSYLNNMGNRDEIEQREDVLVYTTPVLQQDIEITGYIRAVLFAATDCEDTDFIVNIVDVHPDGHTQYLTHGIIRAQYRNNVEEPQLLEPGEIYKYEFDLWPTSNVFLEGHRIRFEVTSSDFDRYARNQNIAASPCTTSETRVAHQSILHSEMHPSHFLVPVIPESQRSGGVAIKTTRGNDKLTS